MGGGKSSRENGSMVINKTVSVWYSLMVPEFLKGEVNKMTVLNCHSDSNLDFNS